MIKLEITEKELDILLDALVDHQFDGARLAPSVEELETKLIMIDELETKLIMIKRALLLKGV